jgi:uncharacterized protein Yka (UPF0111/DUF47 family)
MGMVDSMEHALHYANVKQREAQERFDTKMEALNKQLAQMTMQSDHAVQELEAVQALNDALNEEIHQLQDIEMDSDEGSGVYDFDSDYDE